MTGKNVDTLNTKPCLNMIYNTLFILTLLDQFSSWWFLPLDVTRISESRQYNPLADAMILKTLYFVAPSRFRMLRMLLQYVIALLF